MSSVVLSPLLRSIRPWGARLISPWGLRWLGCPASTHYSEPRAAMKPEAKVLSVMPGGRVSSARRASAIWTRVSGFPPSASPDAVCSSHASTSVTVRARCGRTRGTEPPVRKPLSRMLGRGSSVLALCPLCTSLLSMEQLSDGTKHENKENQKFSKIIVDRP